MLALDEGRDWKNIKQVLAGKTFLEDLTNRFNKSPQLCKLKRRKIKSFLRDPDSQPEQIRKVSVGCVMFVNWLTKLVECAEMVPYTQVEKSEEVIHSSNQIIRGKKSYFMVVR